MNEPNKTKTKHLFHVEKRTKLALLCLFLALLSLGAFFLIQPQTKEDVMKVYRVKSDLEAGEVLTGTLLEEIRIPSSLYTENMHLSLDKILGMKTSCRLYAGDLLTFDRLENVAEDTMILPTLENLPKDRVALSIPISSLSMAYGGHIEKGDIVSCLFYNKVEKECVLVHELTSLYVLDVTKTNATPQAVTLLLSMKDAEQLITESEKNEMKLALLYRGQDKDILNHYLGNLSYNQGEQK